MQDNEEFKKYVETLPAEVQQAIYSVDYPKKLQDIVKNNKLLIDQAGKLEAETTLVMAGIEPLDDYVKNLVANVGLSNTQAAVIAHDVNESIFKGIRDSLKKINDERAEEDKLEKESETATAAPTNPAPVMPQKIVQPTISRQEVHAEMANEGIEIRPTNLPEVPPKAQVPEIQPQAAQTFQKPPEPIHINIPPVQNIVETKMTETVAVPKQTVVVEEKTKLPEKSAGTKPIDPYREAV